MARPNSQRAGPGDHRAQAPAGAQRLRARLV